jgi:hypothetical protein
MNHFLELISAAIVWGVAQSGRLVLLTQSTPFAYPQVVSLYAIDRGAAHCVGQSHN